MVGENLAENADGFGFSRDHGKSWSVVPLPQQWMAESITPAFIGCTSDTCVAYGSNILGLSLTASPSAYRVGLISTSNDGQTWSEDNLPAGTNDLDSIACIASGRCWALYRTQQLQEQVGVSVNGGQTWTTVGGISEAFDPDHFAGFGCATRVFCYVVDDSNDVFATENGGRTWARGTRVRSASGSTDLETDALACTPRGGSCYVTGIDQTASLWKSS